MTRNLQQPPWFGPYWSGRRVGWQGRRRAPHRGRWITYAAPPLTVLALVARVVLASCRRLPMAGRRFPPALPSRFLAALIAPVHMATITAAADRKRPPALPAVPSMQNRHLQRIAHPVRLWRANPGQRPSPVSRCRCLLSAVRFPARVLTNEKLRRSPELFSFPATLSIPPTRRATARMMLSQAPVGSNCYGFTWSLTQWP